MAASAIVDPGYCQCCDNEPAVGVASSGVVPMSIAWGLRCLQRRAEPWSAIEYLLEQANEQGEAFADWFLDGETWKDGRYMTIREAIAGVSEHR